MLRNVDKKVWIGECIRCIQKKTRFRKTLDWKTQETELTIAGGGSPEKPLKQLHTTQTYVIFILKDN